MKKLILFSLLVSNLLADDFFKEFLTFQNHINKELAMFQKKHFASSSLKDKGKFYELKVYFKNIKSANTNIKTSNNILYLNIESKTKNSFNRVKEQFTIPHDASNSINTSYLDDYLIIHIPKK
jgi:hypothetical protein